MYLDANNLYGYAMSQCLPTGGFRWMTEKQMQKVNLAACTEDRKKGMILEVIITNNNFISIALLSYDQGVLQSCKQHY